MKIGNVLLVLSMALMTSCDNEDDVKAISKDGSVETIINVDHLNSNLDVIKTTNYVWIKNVKVKSIVHTDTIPSLGLTTENAENSDGESKMVSLKKEYEVYITVK